MISAPIPHDEASRLAKLFEYRVLDTLPEPNFDELTELLATILKVPIALVSLIDEKRQWFKSHHGLDATETPREFAFCAHAILDNELFIIEDSHVDERFKDNPLVTGDPRVRFYAGMPLITDSGHKIGTVCGIDHKPGVLDQYQMRALEIVSRQVIDQLELRRNIAIRDDLFRQQNLTLQRLESANQEIRDFVSVVAHDLRAPILNAAGFSEELIASTDDLENAIDRAKGGIPDDIRKVIAEIIDKDIRDSATHIRRSAKQMDERISAVASIARHGRRDIQIELVDLNEVVSQVCADHEVSLKQVGGEIAVDALPEIEIDKMSVQLVFENLVANAVKYCDQERPLRIRISADAEPDGAVFHFEDNGRGICSDDLSRVFVMFRRVGKQNTKGDGTGLAFSRTIVNRLGGRIWCESAPDQGSIFHVYLPSCQTPASDVATCV